jgi:TatA/E family protein of Tat protein translocase
MFGSLGIPEILFIMVVALLIFGPRRLPEIGRTLGKALGEFRRATSDLKRSIDTELTLEETGAQPSKSARRPEAPPPVRPSREVEGPEPTAASQPADASSGATDAAADGTERE